MKEFFHEMPYVAWSLVSVMIALSIAASKWEQVKWWWHNTWYSFPLIGKVASLSRDSRRDANHENWFKSEKTLCDEFMPFIRVQSEHDFMENVKYLSLAGDDGRTPMPLFIWILTFSLVIVEALGFSYVLAGYTLPGASENLQETGALGIAFLISVILVVLTHAAGRELYISGKIRQALTDCDDDPAVGKLSTRPVALAEPQSVDDGHPLYVRLTNRVGRKPVNIMGLVAIIFVLIVAIGATFVRGQVLEKQLQEQITGKTSSPAEISIKIGQDGLSFSGAGKTLTLPTADAQENKLADKKAAVDEASIDRQGGWGTFIVLAFVFIFLQIIGVYFGFNWGFAGKHSSKAYEATGGYSRYEDVLQRYDEVSDAAQSKLSDLQQKITKRSAMGSSVGASSRLTFKTYMQVRRDEKESERLAQQQSSDRLLAAQKNRQSSYVMSSDSSFTSNENVSTSFEFHLAEIDKIQDKEQRKSYVLGLDDLIKTQVITELKRRKDDEEKRLAIKQNEELDGLL